PSGAGRGCSATAGAGSGCDGSASGGRRSCRSAGRGPRCTRPSIPGRRRTPHHRPAGGPRRCGRPSARSARGPGVGSATLRARGPREVVRVDQAVAGDDERRGGVALELVGGLAFAAEADEYPVTAAFWLLGPGRHLVAPLDVPLDACGEGVREVVEVPARLV